MDVLESEIVLRLGIETPVLAWKTLFWDVSPDVRISLDSKTGATPRIVIFSGCITFGVVENALRIVSAH